MGLEQGSYISDLVPDNPLGTDQVSEADDHIRLIKKALKNSFPNVDGAVAATPAQLDQVVDNDFDSTITESGVEVAKLSGAVFTGPVYDDGNTPTEVDQLVNKAYVDGEFNTRVPVVLFGKVDGTSGNKIKGNDGWSSSRTGLGVYQLTFDAAITESYSVVVSQSEGPAAVHVFSDQDDSNGFEVRARKIDATGGQDTDWSFILTYNIT